MEHTENEKLDYDSASRELGIILAELKDGKIGIDQLAEKVERASKLAGFCTEKLRDTEDRINKTMKDNGL